MRKKIFISYRRKDSGGDTRELGTRLRNEFGRHCVFLDIDNIPYGTDFLERLIKEVSRCHALVSVIGSTWLDSEDKWGRRRLDDPNDFVRSEIRVALQRNIPIFPVLLEGVRMPSPEELPSDIRPLAFRKGLDARQASFQSDLDRLVPAIGKAIGSRPSSSRKKRPWLRLVAATAVVFIVSGMILAGSQMKLFNQPTKGLGDIIKEKEEQSKGHNKFAAASTLMNATEKEKKEVAPSALEENPKSSASQIFSLKRYYYPQNREGFIHLQMKVALPDEATGNCRARLDRGDGLILYADQVVVDAAQYGISVVASFETTDIPKGARVMVYCGTHKADWYNIQTSYK